MQQAGPRNVRELVDRIKGIHNGFKQTLAALREKIKTLEEERAGLLVEAEELRRVAERRVNTLETEIIELRQEIELLRELLDTPNEENNQK